VTNLEELAAGVPVKDWRIAASCGIHPTAFSLYKTGRRHIPARAAEALATYFSVPLEVVVGDATVPAMAGVTVTERPAPELMPEDWIE
jgi:hypothetical protein